MKNNALLICPSHYKFQVPGCNILIIETDNKDIFSILFEINLKEDFDFFVIPAEINIQEEPWGGIELIKHIRLTPELGDINLKPIVLLHWLPVHDFIVRNKENLFLYSPGIYMYRLPVQQIDFLNMKPLNRDECLNQYLFNNGKETESDHTFRNKTGIQQFLDQVNQVSEMDGLKKDLTEKKIFYKNYGRNFNSKQQKYLVTEGYDFKIAIIDDMAEKWKSAIRKIVKNGEIVTFDNQWAFETYLNTVSEIDQHNCCNYKSLYDKKIDLILLDINFTNNPVNLIEDSAGYKIIEILIEKEIFIPVIIFSASLKNMEPLYKKYDFICGHYIKSYSDISELSNPIKRISEIASLNKMIYLLKLLLKYPYNYLSVESTLPWGIGMEKTDDVKMHLQNLLDVIVLYYRKRITSGVDTLFTNRSLNQILRILCIVREYYCEEIAKDSLIRYMNDIRNCLIHPNPNSYQKVNFEEWSYLSFGNKLKKLEDIMKRTIKGLIAGE